MIYALILGLLVLAGTLVWAMLGARKAGRNAERTDTLEATDAVNDKMLDAAAGRPRDADALRDELHDGRY